MCNIINGHCWKENVQTFHWFFLCETQWHIVQRKLLGFSFFFLPSFSSLHYTSAFSGLTATPSKVILLTFWLTAWVLLQLTSLSFRVLVPNWIKYTLSQCFLTLTTTYLWVQCWKICIVYKLLPWNSLTGALPKNSVSHDQQSPILLIEWLHDNTLVQCREGGQQNKDIPEDSALARCWTR